MAQPLTIRSGPDLGVLGLRADDIARIENWSIFYNLEKRRDKILKDLNDIKGDGLFLCGAPDEWSTESEPVRNFTKVLSFKGFCGAGIIIDERITSNFDYLDVGLTTGALYEGPSNFQGVSGGGLWKVVIKDNGGDLQIEDYLLSGVAFYQCLPKKIICHGRRSIYKELFSKLPEVS